MDHSPLARRHRDRRLPRFRILNSVARLSLQPLHRRRQLRVRTPQRRQIAHQRRFRRQNESPGWISRRTHRSTKTAFFVFTPPPPLELSDLSWLGVEHFEEFMTDLLFDQPWWLPTSIIILGIALFISGNRRQLIRLRNAGAALVIAAVVLMLISFFVETDKEKCLRQTHELVDSVVAADWKKFSSLLDSRVSLGLVSTTIYADQSQLLQGAQEGTQKYGLKAVHILSIKAKQTQSLITV